MKRRFKARLSSRNGFKAGASDHNTDVKSNPDTASAKAKNMKIQFGKMYAITETTSHECLGSLCLNIPHPFDVVLRKGLQSSGLGREKASKVFFFFFWAPQRRDHILTHFADTHMLG